MRDPSETLDAYFVAIQNGDAEAVRTLLAVDRSLTSKKKRGKYKYDPEFELDAYKFLGAYIGQMTGLHLAILNGQESIARDILDATFAEEVDITFGDNNTALHLATFYNSKELVKSLLERGADRSYKNGKGLTSIDLSNDAEILSLLSPQ
ncbi:ankyrin [Basidiobolus meristosporus CBS 931.73]|uniref:Ankyrin n=1 Tax=Basidiobolus meristosporus CBS 931.73 TaxID=1314790 RepID=A0A1Y1XSA2_9FUNG|nr:ankyrin [Basidiobolus meristosporus CBS 931.73]|eukprot:ORX88386.1 ankyrin [Basidiobolus meristosporus CBS 931.73]